MLARSLLAVRSTQARVMKPAARCPSRSMATDAFSGLRSKYPRGKRGDRLDSLDEEARKSVVIALTSDEKLVQDTLKESKAEDAPRIRTMVKSTINSALKALYDGADASKLRQINPNHDFEVPAYEPQTMRESLMKRVVEATIAAKIDEEMHPRKQLLAWANREGEAMTRKILATEAGKTQEAASAQQDADRAAAARRALVDHALKSQTSLFEDDQARDAFKAFSAALDKGSLNDQLNAMREVSTPARKEERARLQKEASDAYKELMSMPGVNASKIKQPTTNSNSFWAKVLSAPHEPLSAPKQ